MTLLNHSCFAKSYFFTLVFLFTILTILPGQSELDCDASPVTVNYNGTYQDLDVPNDPNLVSISFSLKAGDGGGAIVDNCIADGGEGASANATFPVGDGPNEIPRGSTIRFIVGGNGMTGSGSPTFEYGGGGGGSGLLYKRPGSDTWEILMASGGGGGAYVRKSGANCNNIVDGQGGNSSTAGLSGSGSAGPGAGGTNGNGGGWNGLAAGGGGAYSPGGSFTCFGDGMSVISGEGGQGMDEGGAGGGDEGCTGNPWRYGGFGFGGGASAHGAGAGGGGFSGGGGGGRFGSGGGGGTYIASMGTATSINPGGSVNTPQNGFIVYSCTINLPPIAECKDITIYLDENGEAIIAPYDVDDGSNDPDGTIEVMEIDMAPQLTCADIGPHEVTLTVIDNGGMSANCVSTVMIMDLIAPTVVCKDITVELDASGNAVISAGDVIMDSSDNCDIESQELNINSFNCLDIGINTVTLTVTDVNDNSSTCTASVTIVDNTTPEANCKDITIQLDDNGNASIVAADVSAGASDVCGDVTLSIDKSNFTCQDIGDNTVTLTVEDENGNKSTCTAKVTVEDDLPPVARCQDITVQLNASGNASITAVQIDNGSTDNCGPITLSVVPTTFDCGDVGPNSVTLTVTDDNNNSSNCTATVTVEDNVPPSAECKDITVQLNVSGNASITAAQIDNGSNDACGILPLEVSPNTFDCGDVGPNIVTLTVIDNNNNQSTCTATVTVENNNEPNAVCKDITVQLDVSGNASITAADVDGGSTGSCAIASISVNPNTFTCQNVGANTVTLTLTDVNGNTSTCTATVTVEDNVDPDAQCQNITVQLDANGNASITTGDINNGSSDACGIASMSLSETDFTCTDVGPNTVTLTVTDVNGNVGSCNATVTVEDNVDPDAQCQNITVQLDANGNASITTGDINNGSSDACGIASMSLSDTDFTCTDVGPNIVTLTVTDVNGNVGSCDATVTVEDNVDPDAQCQNITVQLDANGNASITTGDINNGSSDACGIASMSLSDTDFTCTDVGPNTVTLTVTDVNGNVGSCDATVTVEDNVDPDAQCQNITVQLDANGNASITTGDINNGSTDACGIASMSLSDTDFTCTDVGPNTVTLTVTDVNGNISTCSATITVEDNVKPSAICQNITVQLDVSGNASITAAQIDNGSNDACGIASRSVSPTSFDCGDIGPNTVTLTVIDNNNNQSTCTATVTVENNNEPNAVCKDITVQLDASGNASITAADVDGGSTGSCAIASISVNPNTFTCQNVGANTVTLTLTDVNGNTSTCTATVTVEDNVDPDAQCQNITVQLDANGNASITTGDINNGSSDACGIASMSLSDTDFTCTDVGPNTVTLTVTDVNGNVGSCDATVTVEDNVDPDAQCQNITVQLDANGNASITTGDINNGSSDACGIASMSLSETDFTCTDVGPNTVTLTVTDVNGNVGSCNATVTVEDNVDPDAQCQNITVQLDANGNASITTGDINNGSSDACGIASMSLSDTDFTCTDVGPNIVTLTVTDVNGNVGSCDATVTVEDNVDPDAQCQNITVQLDANGNASITTGDINNGSSDACGIASMSLSDTDFTCTDVGPNTVTLTVTDVNGNVGSCDATVTVEDNVDPDAQCQNITVQLDANGNASITTGDINNGSTDACGIASMSLSETDFTCTDVGPNTVTLTVTDVNGNVGSCDATVTVEDNVDPDAQCQNITVQLDANGNASITTGDINNGSSDACGIASMSLSETDFTCTDVGPNIVTLTVTDVNGNVGSCDATVTVEDNVDPDAQCQNITVQLDANGNASITTGDINNGSTDACGIASMSLSETDFICTDVGPNTVTLTVTDVNGNVGSCDATVTVEDNVAPDAQCQNITVQLDANGNASITTGDINNGSTDACGIADLSLDQSSFTCSDVGGNTVTLTVEDNNGNTSTCSATVTVEDNVPPQAVCQDITIQLDASGNASVTAADVNNGSSDACGIASMTVSPNTFDCTDVGGNPVTLTITDVNGNQSTCNATVTVENNTTPSAICQDITIQLDASGNASITAADIDGGSTGGCDIASRSIDMENFDCSHVGINTVTLTITDIHGNSSSCTAKVTVEDNIPPTAICQSITVQLNSGGSVSITPQQIDNGSSDACGIANLAVSPTTFNCSNVGSNPVTLTVTDNNGNVNTCSAMVTVQDVTPPVAMCKDITVNLGANGEVTINPNQVDNGSSDACGISLSVSPNLFTCADIGPNTVTLTVTDPSGNSDICTANVEVVDNGQPVALCHDITVHLDETGNVVIAEDEVDNGSYVACGDIWYDTDITTFDCEDALNHLLEGTIVTVTMTVGTSSNSNTASCTAGVTVLYNGPDSDCDGVGDECDVCDGGDDTIDANNDGIPDCLVIPPIGEIDPSWVCVWADEAQTIPQKFLFCHNGGSQNPVEICVDVNSAHDLDAHKSDSYGPCIFCVDGQAAESNNNILDPAANLEQMLVYPNPASEYLHIRIPRRITGQTDLLIIAKDGTLIQNHDLGILTDKVINEKRIPRTADLGAGVYVIKLTNESESITKKVIIVN